MKSRSLLLHVPGMPLCPEALLPQRALASFAACLLATGHETRVADYGTVGAMRRFTPPGLTTVAHQSSPLWDPGLAQMAPGPIAGFFQARGLDALFHEAQEQRWRAVAGDVAAAAPLDFVLFLIHRREDVREALEVGERLRSRMPDLKLLAAGPYMDAFGRMVMGSEETFDCACAGDVEAAIIALADRIGEPETWHEVPNLLYRSGGELRHTAPDHGLNLDLLPAPCYEKSVYPAVHENGKLRLFTLEHSRGCHHVTHQQPETPFPARQVRVKSAGGLCGEMAALGRLFGARTFHITGAATPAAQVDALSREMQQRSMKVDYSRTAHIRHLDPASVPMLAASGCRAIDFQIDTGSQRLLEDFYGHEFGVSEMERVMGACHKAALFTVARLTYPCPKDDYHTRAETLRVLSRTHPAAAPVAPPVLMPGSAWMRSAPDFGYRVDHTGYARWAAARLGRSACFDPVVSDVPYRMPGWTSGRFANEHAALVRDVEELGILTRSSEIEGLLARVAGYEGEEAMFCAALRRRLFCADVKGLTRMLEEFNGRAAVPANLVVLRPFNKVLAAVGN